LRASAALRTQQSVATVQCIFWVRMCKGAHTVLAWRCAGPCRNAHHYNDGLAACSSGTCKQLARRSNGRQREPFLGTCITHRSQQGCCHTALDTQLLTQGHDRLLLIISATCIDRFTGGEHAAIVIIHQAGSAPPTHYYSFVQAEALDSPLLHAAPASMATTSIIPVRARQVQNACSPSMSC
jgi:hypothetical protein